DVVVGVLDLDDGLGGEGGAGGGAGRLRGHDELVGGGGGDVQRGGVHSGEGAVGEAECLGVGGVVEAQAGEGGDAGDGGLGQGAVEGPGARVERDGHGGGVACDGVAVVVLDRDGGLRRECCAGGRAGRLRRHRQPTRGGGVLRQRPVVETGGAVDRERARSVPADRSAGHGIGGGRAHLHVADRQR